MCWSCETEQIFICILFVKESYRKGLKILINAWKTEVNRNETSRVSIDAQLVGMLSSRL